MENHIKEGNERRLEIISGGMIMDRDEIVCNCMGITAGEIREAIEKGAKTVEDIQEATGAGTVCGGCISDIEKLLKEKE
jgi:NAD(P)H-nitrite reductase large subunit